MDNIKTCSTCKIEKPLSNFEFRNDTKKYRCQCNSCTSKIKKIYSEKNKNRISQKRKDNYENNKNKNIEYRIKNADRIKKNKKENYEKKKDLILIQRKEYYKNNIDKIKNKDRNYRINNSEKISAAQKKWQEDNKDHCKKYQKEYYELTKENKKIKIKKWLNENKDHCKEYKRNYSKKQRQNNPNYKIKDILCKRIINALNSKGLKKSEKTTTLLGCSIEEFKNHLRSQFKDGMSFDNHGEWHIDHIKPCASFDLTNSEEQKRCFNFSNLQPLWAIDNLKKGSKIA